MNKLYTKKELFEFDLSSFAEAEAKDENDVISLNLKDITNSKEFVKVFKYKNLQKLSIFYSELEQLQDDIENCTDLQFLHIGSCPISRISEKISTLKHLKELAINDSKVEEIPQDIGNCTDLQSIRMNVNSLHSIPESLNQLKNLKVLDVGNNYIKAMPLLDKLNQLEELNLSNNDIANLDDDFFNGMVNLKLINLNNLPIEDIPSSIVYATNVQRLYLSGTKIADLEVLGKMKNLEKLFLRDCKKLTISQIQNLQEKLPNTRIYFQ